MDKKLRIIADVHGLLDDYIKICKSAEDNNLRTLQLGDLSTSEYAIPYVKLKLPQWEIYHRYIKGNHDYHPNLSDMHLGDWGWQPWGHQIFYVGGAFSIDWKWRQQHHPETWHSNEENTVESLNQALTLYEAVRPDIMISHDCPREVANIIGNPDFLRNWGYDPSTFTTRTSEALQAMFRVHQPKRWFFGHFHKSITLELNGTTFQCLDELEYIDI